jgi:protein-S-isoprenylcysteine O-methyltransferase Ste14
MELAARRPGDDEPSSSCYSDTVNDHPRERATAPPARLLITALVVTGADIALMMLALGGPVALLHHARALALLALWAVSSVTLGLLRPVRNQDVSARTGESRALPLVLFLVPLLAAPVSALCERAGFLVIALGAWRWAGVGVAACGLGLRIAAMRQLGNRFSPRLVLQREHELETGGLYSRIRHPGYLGTLLANLGGALTFGSAVGLAMVGALALVLRHRTIREEAMLAERFGEAYRRYRARTGRFLPRNTEAPGE